MKTTLSDQWAAISGAPIIFLASLFVVGGLIWAVIHFLYRHRLEGLKEELEILRGRMNILENYQGVTAGSATSHARTSQKVRDNDFAVEEETESVCNNRVFLPDRITPRTLMNICRDKAQHKADLELAPYIGKWMKVKAKVGQLSRLGTSWQIIMDTPRDEFMGHTVAYLKEGYSHRLELLDIGDEVEVEGQLKSVDVITVSLENGRLVG